MTRPKKDQPIFPDGHRFSIDMNAMANAEMEGNPQVQPSPGSDYVAKIVPRKFQSLSNVDVSKISGRVKESYPESDDESTSRIIRHAGQMIAERMSRKLSSSQGSLSRSRRHSQMGRQSRVMAGISVDRIIYSNRIIRMIADHEKEEDEINTLVDDWIFFALVIDRILLVFFGIVCLLGSFGLFYRFMFNIRAEEVYEDE